jgi:pheromone shutdown-related protein TraB
MTDSVIGHISSTLCSSAEQERIPTHRLHYDDKEIVVVGIGHALANTPRILDQVMEREKPDSLCIPFCQRRYGVLQEGEAWEDVDILQAIRKKYLPILLFYLFLPLGGIRPTRTTGGIFYDMMRSLVNKAEGMQAQVIFADRDIRISLCRAWNAMNIFSKIRLLFTVLLRIFIREHIPPDHLDKFCEEDPLDLAVARFVREYPAVKTVLVEERNHCLAAAISAAPGCKVLALVDAGHIADIVEKVRKDVNILPYVDIPPSARWTTLVLYLFVSLVIVVILREFLFPTQQVNIPMILGWSSVTASFAGFGALLLLAHPATIVSTAMIAPLTSLHPFVATGWIAGLMEFMVRKPTMGSFLHLAEDITHIRGLFSNKIIRLILLITVVNITTSIGTFIAIPSIMRFFY